MIWDVAAGCALVKAAGGAYHIGAQQGLDRPLEVAAWNGAAPQPE
jgi:3'-phosphoadenosine 5'-phosphosulfate (PAPS) 3'-phosphatase